MHFCFELNTEIHFRHDASIYCLNLFFFYICKLKNFIESFYIFENLKTIIFLITKSCSYLERWREWGFDSTPNNIKLDVSEMIICQNIAQRISHLIKTYTKYLL